MGSWLLRSISVAHHSMLWEGGGAELGIAPRLNNSSQLRYNILLQLMKFRTTFWPVRFVWVKSWNLCFSVIFNLKCLGQSVSHINKTLAIYYCLVMITGKYIWKKKNKLNNPRYPSYKVTASFSDEMHYSSTGPSNWLNKGSVIY